MLKLSKFHDLGPRSDIVHMTQRLDMVYICSKLFENISMDEKVIVRTRKVQLMSICCHFDLDLEATDKSFACDTSY